MSCHLICNSVFLLYSHDQLYKHIIHLHLHAHPYAEHNDDTIKTSNTVLRKIYLALYLKGLCVRGSWRPNRTATYWPLLYWPSVFLSRSPGLLNRGPGGPASLGHVPQSSIFSPTGLISKLLNWGPAGYFCWVLAFSTKLVSNWSGPQINWLPVFTELYNSSTPTFLWASQIALIQPIHGQGYTLLFLDWMHRLFT